MLGSGRWAIVVGLVVAVVALAAPSAPAIVPPKDCGKMKVEGKRYNVKADQIRCKKARKSARRYLARHDKPRGYDCEDYGSETKIEFRCQNGIKVFFAIRR